MATPHGPKQQQYAAKMFRFQDRIQEPLDIEDVKQKLTTDNYKEKFHKLLCWEEKKHIELLEKRCNGVYRLYPSSKRKDKKYVFFCSIEGMNGDQIAYATQASECAVLLSTNGEIKADILPENFRSTDDCMYLAFDAVNAKKLSCCMPHGCEGMNIKVEFEVKHGYFNNLHDAVESLSPVIIARLVPKQVDIVPVIKNCVLQPQSQYNILHLDNRHQLGSLQSIALCPNSNPPFLITGSFGTGKTCLLAAATYHFFQEGHHSQQPVRVLVCAHHQASADTFINNYFGIMKNDATFPWKEAVVRVTSDFYNIQDETYADMYITCREFCQTFRPSCVHNIVIVTTCLTSLHFRGIFGPGFFTHILLDEAAQCREPEAVAALCLANNNTKIVLAGDKMQVGPALLVLGDEAQEYGLKVSLLERLWESFQQFGDVTLSLQCVKLLTNYRSHKDVLFLPSILFYDSTIQTVVPDGVAHPDAPYPLLFVCSSLDNTIEQVESDTDECEATIVLDQTKSFLNPWPTQQWGQKNLSTICLITPTRHQVSVMKKLIKTSYRTLQGVNILPSYDVQGREFQALFLGTVEPTWRDGTSCNPTKSICDQYVFNTVLTRTKSLVVSIGNPFTLLNMERHSTKNCWREYLKLCFIHNTLTVSKNVNDDVNGKLRLLKTLLFGNSTALPSTEIHSSSASSPLISTVPSFPSSAKPVLNKGKCESLSNPNFIPSKHHSNPANLPLNLEKSISDVGKDSKVSDQARPKITLALNPSDISQQPAYPYHFNEGKPSVQSHTNSPSITTQSKPFPSPLRTCISQRSDPNPAKAPQQSAKTQSHPATSVLNPTSQPNKHPVKSVEYRSSSDKCDTPAERHSTCSSKAKPSLPLTKANITGTNHEYSANSTDFGERIEEELFEEDLKEELCRENYKERFHKLLCWEEKEHIEILGKRCNGKYKVHHHKVKPTCITNHHRTEPDYASYCSIEGMTGDKIAYATQSSECAVIIPCAGVELFACILLENNHHTDDHLYLGLDATNTSKLITFIHGNATTFYSEVQFEVKHIYFNNLHEAVESLSSVVIARLLPTTVDVRPLNKIPPIPQSCYEVLHMDTDSPGPQANAVRLIASCPSSNPPFLITGPFGTGKTRLLAAATHHFLQEGHHSQQPVRVLVCAHHQASADTFIDNYFGVMTSDANYPWEEVVLRITPPQHYAQNAKYPLLYDTITNFCSNFDESRSGNVVIVTTFSTSLRLRHKISVGYFTHILLDEAGQAREPESIAPLCFATEKTKIVMAGDKMQVGPALLVLGKEAQQYGLNISLLERLWNVYHKLDHVTLSHQCVQLNVNYRTHKEIMKLASSLFYDSSLTSVVPDSIAHPDATYPLLFVCSSLDDNIDRVERDADEMEARVVLDQAKKFVKKWPSKQWGQKDSIINSVCIITPTRHQISTMRAIMGKDKQYSALKGIKMLPTYDIQGREFHAVFLGTVEPTDLNGMTCNPTKSICDQFVFNTVITRAQSLVVAVGNPFMLLKMEHHHSKHCWREYLNLCAMHGTLIVSDCVDIDTVRCKLQILKTIISNDVSRIPCTVSAPQQEKGTNQCPSNSHKRNVVSLDEDVVKENQTKQPVYSVPATPVARKSLRVSDYYIKNRKRCLDLIQQELTAKTYRVKFHELLAFEEEEHERRLKERCDGTYDLVLCSDCNSLPEYLNIDEGVYAQYGYLQGKVEAFWDGDNISYVTQATEDKYSMEITIMDCRIFAGIVSSRNYKPDYLWIGLDESNCTKLFSSRLIGRNNGATCKVTVSFILKHSYFDRMHNALDALNAKVIEAFFPKPQNFHGITNCTNLYCDKMDVQPDRHGQQQALNLILSSQSKAIVLITGPFGTGKTLLLAHAVYHVMEQNRNARILVCAHHQKSADAFVEKYFGPMKQRGWKPNLVHLSYRRNPRSRFQDYCMQTYMIKGKGTHQLQVVVSTFGYTLSLLNVLDRGFFTHIFIDEAAQTREPETIIPLCLASSETKIVIAGDHCQVGPALLVLGDEAQEHGLKYSLLQRLHQQYEKIGRRAESHCAVLLHNYRCHSGILRLSSSLFYNSTLQSMVPDDITHPYAPYPLLFVCSSLDASTESTPRDVDIAEAMLVLDQVKRFVSAWPSREWNKRKLETICVMTTSSNQKTQIMNLIKTKYKFLNGISVLVAYDMQGTEYRALFLSTLEYTCSDGSVSNPTKSICDPFVFNTAITRAQSLVVSVGNPFMLLKIEGFMEQKYGLKARCWREYLMRCIECKTFIIPLAQQSVDENFLDAGKQLQSMLFTDMSEIVALPHDHDSILAAYAKVFNDTPECHQAQLIINRNISWSLSNKESSAVVGQNDDLPHDLFSARYECLLSCSRYDKADAIPLDPSNHLVKIIGANNRRGAFDGDTILVGVFKNNSPEQKGRVIKCLVHRSTTLTFACHVDSTNPILFVPLNNKDPKIVNLPKLSRDLLKRKSQLGLDKEIKATEVVVFKDTWDGIGLPQINDAIPYCIARKMLFVVRFLCWNPKYRLPLGIVVAAIPQGLSFFHAQRLLKVEHGVSDLEVTKSFIPCDSVAINTTLKMNERAFTIDPEGAQNLDDAISLVLLDGSTGCSHVYEMAVHIANVAKYIERDSDEDKAARKAGTSVYGTKSTGCAHLLPDDLRSKLSLSPMKVRDVVSVVCTVNFENPNDPHLSEPEVKETQIISQLQLTYQAANDVLGGKIPSNFSHDIDAFNSAEPLQPSLMNSLRLLYKIAFAQRQTRLGVTAAFSYSINEDSEESCWQAHLMVEELMIWANHVIAKSVYNVFPDCALLRRQRCPNNEERSACLGLHSLILNHSLSLRPLLSQQIQTVPIKVPHFVIQRLIEAVKNSDVSLLSYLLTADHYYPQLAVCNAQLQSTYHKAEYCCPSGENDPQAIAHYSLHLNLYTHFTSPIRRYMDIVVQRMTMCCLHAGDEDQFTVQMCKDLCHHLNSRSQAARFFENGLKQVSLGLELAAHSIECFAFVKQLDKSSVDLYFPDLRFKVLSSKQRSIKLRSFGFLEKNHSRQFMYQWKIKMLSFEDSITIWGYDTPLPVEDIPEDKCKSRGICKIEVYESTDDNHFKAVHLGANLQPCVRNVDAEMWKELQSDACKEAAMVVEELKGGTCKGAVERLSSNLVEATKMFLEKMSLEGIITQQDPFKTLSPLLNYSLFSNMDMYDLLKVWMSWEAKDGLIAPSIQMVQLSPNAHVCIQHNSSPAECFSDASLPQASKLQYNSISEYVDLWEPLVLAEGAEISVKQGQIIIIQNVILKWPELAIPLDSIDDLYYEPKGPIIVEIPYHFQKTSAVFIDAIKIGDMMCVRYGTIPGSKGKAVFHMVVTKLNTDEDSRTLSSFEMKIFGKQNCRISNEVKTILHLKCELQLIRMTTPIQRVFSTLSKLRVVQSRPVSKVTTQIALGSNISTQPLPYTQAALDIFAKDPRSCNLWSLDKPLNNVQCEAITKAIKHPFFLIQGPPGTGKSETGAHLAYVFAMTNRHQKANKCVLYCGPSNKAVDVVLEKLHVLIQKSPELNLKVLRIYGQAIEKNYFIGPDGQYGSSSDQGSDYECPDFAEKYALHNMIREGSYGHKILDFEKLFKALGDKKCVAGIPLRQEFSKCLRLAKQKVLQQSFDIVLCTCNESCGQPVEKYIQPLQCIVDECAMAQEPETMAPISLCEHVILIGDHKQLTPVINYVPAKSCGLGTSLFQRYADSQCFKHLYITLTIQYRMHKAIQHFPSNYFYFNKLKPADIIRTRKQPDLSHFWPVRGTPIVFCDVVGEEGQNKASSKRRRKAVLESKCNEIEAQKVVQIASRIYSSAPDSTIAILTPYSAQKEVIIEEKTKALVLKGQKEWVKVATITESQGDEFDFVILSLVRSQPFEDIKNPDHVWADRGWVLENLGFITDQHQINVGITRSKFGLVLVGNRQLLEYDETWKSLLDSYDELGCIVDGKSFPPT